MSKNQKLELFRDVMFAMFKEGCLPELDMDDYKVMWEALAEKWEISQFLHDWDDIIEDINCRASNSKEWFDEKFQEYYGKNI